MKRYTIVVWLENVVQFRRHDLTWEDCARVLQGLHDDEVEHDKVVMVDYLGY